MRVGLVYKGVEHTLGVSPYSETPGLVDLVPRDGVPVTERRLWLDAILLTHACNNNVNRNYLASVSEDFRGTAAARAREAQKDRDGCFILYQESSSRRGSFVVPRGFVLTVMHGPNVHIDVICAESGFGSPLLKTFLEFFDRRGLNVDLDSLASVLMYYPKFGFEYRNSCSEDPYVIPEHLKARLQAKIKNETAPTTNKEAYNDDDWLELMTQLTRRKLSAKKGRCLSVKTKNAVASNNCAQDGFAMVRCKYMPPLRIRKPPSMSSDFELSPSLAVSAASPRMSRSRASRASRPASRPASRSRASPKPSRLLTRSRVVSESRPFTRSRTRF